jgi:hypothetical protein
LKPIEEAPELDHFSAWSLFRGRDRFPTATETKRSSNFRSFAIDQQIIAVIDIEKDRMRDDHSLVRSCIRTQSRRHSRTNMEIPVLFHNVSFVQTVVQQSTVFHIDCVLRKAN